MASSAGSGGVTYVCPECGYHTQDTDDRDRHANAHPSVTGREFIRT